MVAKLLLAHPRSGSTWFRRLLLADPRRKAFRLTHVNTFISGSGVVHRPMDLRERLRRISKSKVIVLCRDPRDIAISLYYFCHDRCRNGAISFAPFVAKQTTQTIRHYSMIRAESLNWSSCMWVHYEDLVREPESELRRSCEFFRFPTGDLESAVEKHSFRKMQDRDRRRVYDKPDFKWKYSGNERSLQVRKGISGQWREYFEDHSLPEPPHWMLSTRTT